MSFRMKQKFMVGASKKKTSIEAIYANADGHDLTGMLHHSSFKGD